MLSQLESSKKANERKGFNLLREKFTNFKIFVKKVQRIEQIIIIKNKTIHKILAKLAN